MIPIDEGALRWLVRTAHGHHWRVASWIDVDDLIQEGAFDWYRLQKRYPNVTEARHLMALFKRCFINRLHTLARDRTRANEVLLLDAFPYGLRDATADSEDLVLESLTSPEPFQDPTVLTRAPEPIRALFSALAGNTEWMRRPYRRRRAGVRETTNERWCRVTGLDPETVDLPGSLKSYLTGA